MIKESAILYNGVLVTGRRHCDAYNKLFDMGIKPVGGIQGFIDDKENFLTRDAAEAHARACGQLTKPTIGSILTSEDLW